MIFEIQIKSVGITDLNESEINCKINRSLSPVKFDLIRVGIGAESKW